MFFSALLFFIIFNFFFNFRLKPHRKIIIFIYKNVWQTSNFSTKDLFDHIKIDLYEIFQNVNFPLHSAPEIYAALVTFLSYHETMSYLIE